jgi:hypothetical protein
MLGKYAAAYLVVVEAIDGLISNLERLPKGPPNDGSNDALILAVLGKERPLDDWLIKNVQSVVETSVDTMVARVEMPSVSAQARRIKYTLTGKPGPTEIISLLKELRTRIFDELNERQFLYVPPDRAKFFTEPMQFGERVNDRFKDAIDDIEEAGKCLALGRATGCVLHTMRVLEVGLKALARALDIPYAPSWESYLKQISTKIGEDHKKKSLKWKREEKFYRDLSGDLLTVKQAWRNPTMHVDRKYSVDEAEQIFNAAKHFMQRLADHFTEKQMKKLLKEMIG